MDNKDKEILAALKAALAALVTADIKEVDEGSAQVMQFKFKAGRSHAEGFIVGAEDVQLFVDATIKAAKEYGGINLPGKDNELGQLSRKETMMCKKHLTAVRERNSEPVTRPVITDAVWDMIDDNVQFIAMGESGKWYAYPEGDEPEWYSCSSTWKANEYKYLPFKPSDGPVNFKAKNSLCVRPS